MARRGEKIGLWLIGACGGVGSTVALGLAALCKKLTGPTGLVTEQPQFDGLNLPPWHAFVLGGHEFRKESLIAGVHHLSKRAGLFDDKVVRACRPRLVADQRNIRPGTTCGLDPAARRMADFDNAVQDRSAAAAVDRLASDITDFRRRKHLDHVVVINVASSEPGGRKKQWPRTISGLRRSLSRRGESPVPTSSIYALAAVDAGCAYINFTPSTGILVPAIRAYADDRNVPYMGRDGKTGETLVKSVLAPMFAMRNLNVMSWVGQNILGNRDGATLNDPATRRAKIATKDRLVHQVLNDTVTSHVRIDYVPSLADWKVAWDYIHFRGFLGVKMSLQFTWCGSDSVLAAPLVLDLARLAVLECRRGVGGPMKHLACFFKDPLDVSRHDLFSQWVMLMTHTTAQS